MKTLFLLSDFSDGFSWISILISIGVFILVFLVLREFFCWYWKINETIEELKTISKNLKKLVPPEDKKEEVEIQGWKRL